MVDPAALIPPPNPNEHPRNDMWVDEQIWGHRLWDSQSPWLLFLEFLCLAEASHRDGKLLDEGGVYYPLRFKPYKRMHLRNILFNNNALLEIAQRYPDSATAWSHWLEWMEEHAGGVTDRNFSYLKPRFHSFRQFVSLIGMMRSSAVENESNRRWSSRFLFPFGPNALYEDLRITAGSVSREYINFGLTGELLYKMLSRSAHSAQLRPRLATFLEGKNSWNALLALFQPSLPDDLEKRGNSFLPYKQHPVFDRFGEDWLQVLELNLPGFDALPHLVILGAFHVLLYQLRVAADWSVGNSQVFFVCEMVAPKKTLVRELSSQSYQANNELSQQAIEAYLRRLVDSEEWLRLKNQPGGFTLCKGFLEEKVRWPTEPENYDGCADPEALFQALRRAAISRHRRHVANIHRNYGRDVGLVSKRGTNKLRYAPNDGLLKSLILANVEHRLEFKEFLNRLFERYGLVIGEREAERVLSKDDFDKKAFQANSDRLEQRLTSLGVLRRLSDACAYVQNPFDSRSP